MDNRDRFLVLKDKTIPIDSLGGNSSAVVKMFNRINLPTIFNAGTAGTVSDITSGAIYLLAIGESATGAGSPTTVPFIEFQSRIRYDDS